MPVSDIAASLLGALLGGMPLWIGLWMFAAMAVRARRAENHDTQDTPDSWT